MNRRQRNHEVYQEKLGGLTFGQSAAAVLVSSVVIQDVDWALVLGSAALAALLSLTFSLAGLPELPDADGDGIPDGADDSQ